MNQRNYPPKEREGMLESLSRQPMNDNIIIPITQLLSLHLISF